MLAFAMSDGQSARLIRRENVNGFKVRDSARGRTHCDLVSSLSGLARVSSRARFTRVGCNETLSAIRCDIRYLARRASG